LIAFPPKSEVFSSQRDALGKPRASAMPPATRAALGRREVGDASVLKGRANRAIDRTIVRPYRTRASCRIDHPGLRAPVKPSRLPWAFQVGPFRSEQNREPSGSLHPSTHSEQRPLKMQPNRHRPPGTPHDRLHDQSCNERIVVVSIVVLLVGGYRCV
jgi:hypothetical protein